MNLQDIPQPFRSSFEQTPDVIRGKVRVRGTRISVEQVLELLESGASPAEIVESFPSLRPEEVAVIERLAAHFALLMLRPA